MYSVLYKKSAEKELLSLPKEAALKIRKAINLLAANPYPKGYKKLAGHFNAYRIRIGNYRVIYSIENKELLIIVIKIAHHKEVYR
jgi:mRNA interferase RelE/StbE